jgi:tetratricopeptide (TPR) repeat protein
MRRGITIQPSPDQELGMGNMRAAGILCILSLVPGTVAARQASPDHVALGREAADARDPAGALRHFESALAADSMGYEANWRAAIAAIDVGKQTPDSVKSPERDRLYALAERYAKRAVKAELMGADGHFALAAAIGRASLTKSAKERVQRASEIRIEALKALEINPRHDGAWHVLGRWNAEIMRLSGVERFVAKNFLGGTVFNKASWAEAERAMAKAVEYRPNYLYHRLDLAEIYADQKKFTEAESQLRAVADLPVSDVMDPQYKKDAALLLARITRGRQ